MTLRDFKATLAPEVTLDPQPAFLVDFDAIAVQRGGEVQFYILHLAGEPFTDDDIIQGLYTDNPTYQTAEGVGPGTAIAQAEAVYGEATLSYNLDNEGREYVRFAEAPFTNVAFGTGNANTETAGIYDNPSAAYNETTTFNDGAAIATVLIICRPDACAIP